MYQIFGFDRILGKSYFFALWKKLHDVKMRHLDKNQNIILHWKSIMMLIYLFCSLYKIRKVPWVWYDSSTVVNWIMYFDTPLGGSFFFGFLKETMNMLYNSIFSSINSITIYFSSLIISYFSHSVSLSYWRPKWLKLRRIRPKAKAVVVPH